MSATIHDKTLTNQPIDDVIVRKTRDEEWANGLTHCIAAISTIVLGWVLIRDAAEATWLVQLSCYLYTASVLATFVSSTLSHWVSRQPQRDLFRSWDQGMIYAMIVGTYTPVVAKYGPQGWQLPVITLMWCVALTGIIGKLVYRHRLDNTAMVTYLLLGWVPAITVYANVPVELGLIGLLGGVLYTIGVAFLVNDHRAPYLHVVWHLLVMTAAFLHWWVIHQYVVLI